MNNTTYNIYPYNQLSSARNINSLSSKDYMLMSDLMSQPAYQLDINATNPRNFIKPINSPVMISQQLPNGGLYGGVQSTEPWANIPIIPEMHIYVANLESANPPPNAMKQMIGTNRLGNNTIIQPSVKFYVPPGIAEIDNPYSIYITQ